MIKQHPNSFKDGFKIVQDNYEKLILEPDGDEEYKKLLKHLEFKDDDYLN